MQAFASTFPTMVAYVIDTPRCTQPQVFMSNMLQVRSHIIRPHCTLPLSSIQVQFCVYENR
jgi:GPN-loop GTPase